MNFFYLDHDPVKSAEYMVDRHVVKMILEHCQMLSTVQHLNGIESLYKPTHVNHPCTIWARTSLQNYKKMVDYTWAICKEYTSRYGKRHNCEGILCYCEVKMPKLPEIGETPIALAMPEQYKCEDPVKSYRNYYIAEKRHIANWKHLKIPEWWA